MLTSLIEKWFESVFFKRLVTAAAAGAVSYWAGHQAFVLAALAKAGVHVAGVQIDPATLADFLTLLITAASQGAQDWLVKKLPGLGKLIGGGATLLLAIALVSAPANAQSATPAPTAAPPSPQLVLPFLQNPIDLANVIANTHPCYVYDQHRDSLAGAYLPGVSIHRGDGLSIVDFNVGAAWDTASRIGGPFGSIGFRFDNLPAMLDTNRSIANHVIFAPLPHFEAGPWGGYIYRKGWLYGAFVSMAL